MVSLEWSPLSPDQSLEAYLAQNRPSAAVRTTLNDYGQEEELAWYFVRSADYSQVAQRYHDRFREEGNALRIRLEEKVEEISRTAPKRANKSSQSQSQLVGELNKIFTADLYALARETGVTSGKWMLFTDRKWVDEQWSRIAHSLGDPTGALALHPACMAAKVSASEYKEGQGYLVCIYVKDAFDVRAVGEGLAILRDELRIATGYFKTDAMTIAGIYASHVSKCKSTLYSAKDFLPGGSHATSLATLFPSTDTDPAVQSNRHGQGSFSVGPICAKPLSLELLAAGLQPLSDDEA